MVNLVKVMKDTNHRAFNVLGNTAVVNFPEDYKLQDKKDFAQLVLMKNPGIKTVLEKSRRFSGRLRKMQTKYVFGEKTKEILYKENNCVFRFNIDDTYFSPRLSNERKEIASMIKKGDRVLVMFAGVAPFSIVIAKNSQAGKIISNEINKKANKYAQLNIELNKVKDRVELLQGDIKRLVKSRNSKLKEKFDVIVMPRPQLKDSFLKEAFALSKKGTRIYYYDFTPEDKIEEVVEKVKQEAKNCNIAIKVIKQKRAGEIAPFKVRIRIDIQVV